MRARRAIRFNVQNLTAADQERIRQERTMTAPPDGLGTHDGRRDRFPKHQQIFERTIELRRQHVIGIPSEAGIFPGAVWRIRPRAPKPSKTGKCAILDPLLPEQRSERITGKVWMPTRSGYRTNIGKLPNAMCVQERQKFVR
jgi:hypothetical protein